MYKTFDAKGKVCLLGPAASGKSELRRRFENGDNAYEINGKYEVTEGVEFGSKKLKDEQSGKNIKLEIWEIGGESGRHLIYSYLHDTVALIITCDVSNKEGAKEALSYWKSIKKHVRKDCSVFLVGTKGDLAPQEINSDELEVLAQRMETKVSKDSIKVSYWGITSAKTSKGIHELSAKIANIVAEKSIAEEKKDARRNEKEPLIKNFSSGASSSRMFSDNSSKGNGFGAWLLTILKYFFLCGCCCPEKEVEYSPRHLSK